MPKNQVEQIMLFEFLYFYFTEYIKTYNCVYICKIHIQFPVRTQPSRQICKIVDVNLVSTKQPLSEMLTMFA